MLIDKLISLEFDVFAIVLPSDVKGKYLLKNN